MFVAPVSQPLPPNSGRRGAEHKTVVWDVSPRSHTWGEGGLGAIELKLGGRNNLTLLDLRPTSTKAVRHCQPQSPRQIPHWLRPTTHRSQLKHLKQPLLQRLHIQHQP